jgi:hypothetical protein
LSLCLYVVLSCVGTCLCDGLITRPEESYHLSIRLRNLWCEAAKDLARTVEPLMMMINKVLTSLFKITIELLSNVRIVGGLIISRISSLFFYSAPRSYVIVVNLWKPVIHI